MMAWERARGRSAKWFLAPALALLAVFVVWPLVRAGVWSFTNADLLSPERARGVGLDNYTGLWADGRFRRAFLNTWMFALLVVPAQALHGFADRLKPHLRDGHPLVICAKGIEQGSGKLVTEVLEQAAPQAAAAILSGPSFARDVARGLPTAVTIAAKGHLAAMLQASLGSATFRPYASDDLTGVALGGAAKNVYAIACGVVEGMGLGENARAALLARSFAELARLGESLGAKRETLMGLSGLGDLVLTATSKSSRNFSFGAELGAGKTVADLSAPGQPLAEGASTAPALVARAKMAGVEMPIAEAMADLLSGALPPGEAVLRLMGRKLKAE